MRKALLTISSCGYGGIQPLQDPIKAVTLKHFIRESYGH